MQRFVGIRRRSLEVPHFGGDYKVIALEPEPLQDAGKHALSPTIAIDIGVVEVVDSIVNGQLDGSGDFTLVHVGPTAGPSLHPVQSAHGPAAEAHFGDLDVGSAQSSVFHELEVRKNNLELNMDGQDRQDKEAQRKESRWRQ